MQGSGFFVAGGVFPSNNLRKESFDMAKREAYREGKLEGSSNKKSGKKLPSTYFKDVKPVAERRATLAGYRLADLMRDLF